ncbi:Uncharacterised protein [Yersinia frederiksenii]|nr:Uncharacterised protein [Yersinia frederiksenii]
MLVKVKVTEPSAPVVPLAEITPLLSALKFTSRLGIRFPSASVTIAFTELVATPFANAPLVSILSAPLTIVAVPLLGIKFTSTLWLLPLTLAVTLVTPDLMLVKVKVTEPSAPVVPLAAITPLLSALKFTNRFGIRFPSASVTIAFTELVATPLANAPLVSILNAPLTMVAVPLLGIKFTSTLWLLPLTLAVTLVTPDLMLVKVKVTEPSAPVVPLAAITPLLSALKFTSRFGTKFPSASVTIAFTRLVAIPFASAPSTSILNAPLTIVAVPLLGIKFTSTLWLLPLTVAVTWLTPAVVLVSGRVTEPSVPVVPLVAILAPLLATKLTARLGIGLPLASVTTAFTELVATPLASAPSVTIVNAPLTMVAVPLSGTKFTFTLWL